MINELDIELKERKKERKQMKILNKYYLWQQELKNEWKEKTMNKKIEQFHVPCLHTTLGPHVHAMLVIST